jgi:hypothetical protein
MRLAYLIARITIEPGSFMSDSRRLPTPCNRSELLARRFAGITHSHIDIFMSMIALWIVSNIYISVWKMSSNGHMIEVALMMVVMPPLNDHSAAHYSWKGLNELIQEVLRPRPDSLRWGSFMKYD